MLDNDLIRLNQKVNVILSLREQGKTTEDGGKTDVKASLKKPSSNSESSNNE